VTLSIRLVRKKLDAFDAGGPLPLYDSKVTRISSRPIIIAFVRMAAESRPWGIVYGRAGDQPNYLAVPDPRGKSAVEPMITTFATWLLNELRIENYSTSPLSFSNSDLHDLPQIWFPGSSHVEMLHFLQYQYQSRRNEESEPSALGTFGRLCGFLFRESRIKGNQLVINASSLLNELYVFPADDFSTSHLGVQMAWLLTRGSISEKREQALVSGKETISITMSPQFDREKLEPLVKKLKGNGKPDTYLETQSTKIKTLLFSELERRWLHTLEAHSYAQADSRLVNNGVQVFLREQFNKYVRFNEFEKLTAEGEDVFTPAANTNSSSYSSARELLLKTDAEDRWLPTLLNYDVSLLRESLLDGTSFIGTVCETGTGTFGNRLAPYWKVRLSTRSSKYFKRRENLRLSIFNKTDYKLKLESYVQEGLDWIMTLSWEELKKPVSITTGKQGLQKDSIWVGDTIAFVPQVSSFVHDHLKALKKSKGGPASFLTEFPSTESEQNAID
jgi:hypothetical protein